MTERIIMMMNPTTIPPISIIDILFAESYIYAGIFYASAQRNTDSVPAPRRDTPLSPRIHPRNRRGMFVVVVVLEWDRELISFVVALEEIVCGRPRHPHENDRDHACDDNTNDDDNSHSAQVMDLYSTRKEKRNSSLRLRACAPHILFMPSILHTCTRISRVRAPARGTPKICARRTSSIANKSACTSLNVAMNGSLNCTVRGSVYWCTAMRYCNSTQVLPARSGSIMPRRYARTRTWCSDSICKHSKSRLWRPTSPIHFSAGISGALNAALSELPINSGCGTPALGGMKLAAAIKFISRDCCSSIIDLSSIALYSRRFCVPMERLQDAQIGRRFSTVSSPPRATATTCPYSTFVSMLIGAFPHAKHIPSTDGPMNFFHTASLIAGGIALLRGAVFLSA